MIRRAKANTGKGPVKATHTVAISEHSTSSEEHSVSRRRGKSPGSHGGKNTRRYVTHHTTRSIFVLLNRYSGKMGGGGVK